MEKHTVNTEVGFYASLGYVQGSREETFTLGELGLSEEDLEEMSEKELEEYLSEAHANWMDNFASFGWEFK